MFRSAQLELTKMTPSQLCSKIHSTVLPDKHYEIGMQTLLTRIHISENVLSDPLCFNEGL